VNPEFNDPLEVFLAPGPASDDPTEIAYRVLRSMNERDRNALIRFYLDEETPAHICSALGITEAHFRLIRVRARALFAEGRNSPQAGRKAPGRSGSPQSAMTAWWATHCQ